MANLKFEAYFEVFIHFSVVDLGGVHPVHMPPLRPKIFSISCSFWENLTKSYVGAPPRGSVPPPTGNPGSAPVSTVHFRGFQRLEGASSFVTLGWVIICDFKFKRTEKHDFTLTTNMNQHVEFFHFLIFLWSFSFSLLISLGVNRPLGHP